jgi:hypothetical protein
MINSVMNFDCADCNGSGLIFFGDDLDYDVKPCDCDDFALGDLFTSEEAE